MRERQVMAWSLVVRVGLMEKRRLAAGEGVNTYLTDVIGGRAFPAERPP